MTLADIRTRLDHISEVWRAETANEQKTELTDLDDLLGELDDLDAVGAAELEKVDELRGRVEILMDEIDICLGIEPPPIAGYTDL
jgi:ribosome assembly protein YihI (activator of Der GTPase)